VPDMTQPSPALSPVKQALLEIRRLRAQLAERPPAEAEPVAIVGMAVRLPGGIASLDDFWTLLAAGETAITPTPAERWDDGALFDADADRAGKTYSRHGGFLAGADRFDAAFFGITPREAESMDPQHRILLELTWEALEHAGIPADRLAGTPAGVFIGLSNSDYGRMLLEARDDIDAYSSFGLAVSVAAGRISYFLDARGPSLVLDTACSSSLTAVHVACKSLASRESSLAIAGAANLILTPDATISFSHARMLSRDGQCRTFDAAAGGYVRSEGCAVVILKRLSDAEADGDRILAVIRGSAANHDGRSAGLTAPNGPAQTAVIQAALRDAKLAPADIDYVEAHGTGTPLGDPIEVQALGAAYAGREADRPLLIGSVKTNLGHLEAAAGLAGLIKVLLSLQYETLPAHRNFTVPNPHVAWDELPVAVVRTAQPWHRGARARRAGVSAFGFSGTNVHVVLEEAPQPARTSAATPPAGQECLFLLSARTDAALRDLSASYAGWLDRTGSDLAEICRAAATGRAHHRHRLAATARDPAGLAATLRTWLAGGDVPCLGAATAAQPAPTVGLFRPALDDHAAGALLAALAAACPAFAVCIAPAIDGAAPAQGAALQHALGRFFSALGLTPLAVFGPGEAAAGVDLLLVLGPDAAAAPAAIAQRTAVLAAAPAAAWPALLDALRALYLAGANLAWNGLYRTQGARSPAPKPDLPTYAFQRQSFWRPRRPASAIPPAAVTDWPKLAASVALQSETGPLGWDVTSYETRWRLFDVLTAGHAIDTLAAFGEFAAPGARASADDLIRRHGIVPLYRDLLNRWLGLLAREGVLHREGHGFASPQPLQPRDLSHVWRDLERLMADDLDMLHYAQRASGKLRELLTGRTSPLEVLFARGDLDPAERIYERSPGARYLNAMAVAALRSALEDHRGAGPFRVVEVGAGTGGTTSRLAEGFPADGEYWFTDLSDAFLGRGRQRFGKNPAFRFAKFNLDLPPPAELPAGVVDVVVAANVVHATRDVGVTLDRMRALLKPGGLLILIESTMHHSFFDITIAFIEGWSSFADAYRTDHPLLGADRWTALLRERGFIEAERFPNAGAPADMIGQHVLIARNALDAGRDALVTAAPPDTAPQPVPAPVPAAPAPVARAATAGEREKLEHFVRLCAARVMYLDPATRPQPRERFSDLGMDSLMALQLQSQLAEGLGLGDQLPATIAFDTGTVEALTDAVLTLIAPAPAPAAAPAAPAAPAAVLRTVSAADLDGFSDDEVAALLAQRVRANHSLAEDR
jgi:3-oxoacyl-(acyl-carrier-protein) synthase/SAM-dependent methyltransferase